ncbi:MAG: hypothetical protein OXC00_15475 [Acidimicrobiaceae bacterium]|nr:hypothetical protein [Acidimicrobiaceae bacterium]
MEFSVETWAPEYGVAVDAESLEQVDGDVVVDAERPAGDWSAIDPQPEARPPERVVFIDGVRRVDARVWITIGSKTHAGLCASVAAGTVRCEKGKARVVRPRVFRGVYADAAVAGGPIDTRHGAYEFVPCTSSAPDDLYRAIHERMTVLETQIADVDAELVVFDGPLRGRTYLEGVGFIKTQHVQYLPDREQLVLATLGAGQRTPLFLIGGPRFSRWSWYLRLPGPLSHPMSGIARCELPGRGSVSDAALRADAVTATLPRYASEPHKDSRAPQNLYPIAGLEDDLRRRLGDRDLMERALRRAAR